jgi:HTH-type transcriptional regulator / antitoxin HipB
LTQSQLAQRLGVVQSRVADIERDPGAVSVEQMLQVLAILGAQWVVRETADLAPAKQPSMGTVAPAQIQAQDAGTASTVIEPQAAAPRRDSSPQALPDDLPRCQW